MQIYVPEDLKRKQTHVNLLHTCTVDGIEKKKTEKKEHPQSCQSWIMAFTPIPKREPCPSDQLYSQG